MYCSEPHHVRTACFINGTFAIISAYSYRMLPAAILGLNPGLPIENVVFFYVTWENLRVFILAYLG